MEPHPIRIVVKDDLERSRLTVFFRLLLAIPLLLWLLLWSVAAFLLAVVNWFVTLVLGRLPQGLHDFMTAYVRFATHVHAYLYLAGNPYPGFTGEPGYPVDLEIEPPAPQNRWKTAFRALLALPALLLMSALFGGPGGGGGGGGRRGTEAEGGEWWVESTVSFTGGGAAFAVAVLGWFACLATGRMPLGFRDLVAFALRYAAQFWSYFFLLTDRYPNSDPSDPPATQPTHSKPIRIRVEDNLRRSRLTVFFRFLLFLPHLVWLILWGLAALLAAIAGWFATLVLGSLPDALHRFLAAYVRYQTHVYAFVFLVANPFPGFTGAAGSYPVDVEIDPRVPQNRWKTAFRLLLAVPAIIVSSALDGALVVAAFLGWFVGLALGRMPESLRNLGAYALRYAAQTSGYLNLLTDSYPYSGPTEYREPEPEPEVVPV
jgi:Domain of unknown function (DUF4389)